jgi:hypothetical protein
VEVIIVWSPFIFGERNKRGPIIQRKTQKYGSGLLVVDK